MEAHVRIGPEWREHLGDINLLGDWTAFMRSQAKRLGWEDLLLLWWPRLLPRAGGQRHARGHPDRTCAPFPVHLRS